MSKLTKIAKNMNTAPKNIIVVNNKEARKILTSQKTSEQFGNKLFELDKSHNFIISRTLSAFRDIEKDYLVKDILTEEFDNVIQANHSHIKSIIKNFTKKDDMTIGINVYNSLLRIHQKILNLNEIYNSKEVA